MRRNLLLLVGSFLCYTTSGQTCSCKDILATAITKVESNYAGFMEKSKHQIKYLRHKTKAIRNAAKEDIDCILVLNEYLLFFKDKHLILNENNASLIVDAGKINKKTKERKNRLQGVWHSELNKTIVKFIRSGKHYLGYAISSEDTDIAKGTLLYDFWKTNPKGYHGVVYNKYKQKIIYSATLEKAAFKIKLLETLTKGTDTNSGRRKFLFRKMNDTVCYLKIPSFSSYYKKNCDTLVENNTKEIEQSTVMIIDIRDNSGGSVNSFSKLFKYIYTNPTQYVSGFYYASNENITRAKERYENGKKNRDSVANTDYQKLIAGLEENKNGFYFENPDTLRRENIFDRPGRVFIITNDNTASAAEMFVIMARQNSKTRVVGGRTNGASDYLEPQFYSLCNSNFILGVPWIKRSRIEYPKDIDNYGIPPDIYLTGREDDWLMQILTML